MKRILLLLCFCGYSILSYSQDSKSFHSILDECILYCIDSLTVKIDYISRDNYPLFYTFKSPEFDKIQRITLLNPKKLSFSLRRKMQKIFQKRGVDVMLFDGIELVQDTLTVIFSFRRVQRTRKETNIGISEWVISYYCYSQEKQEWICVKRKIGGI